jgi:hypothetical protein
VLDLALFSASDWLDSNLLASFVDRSVRSIEFALRFDVFETMIKKVKVKVDDALLFCMMKVLAADHSLAVSHSGLSSTMDFINQIRDGSVSLITIVTVLAFQKNWTTANVAEEILKMLDWGDEELRVWTVLCYGHCTGSRWELDGWELKLLENQCQSELEELAVLAVLTEEMEWLERPFREEVYVWFERYRKSESNNWKLFALRFFAAYCGFGGERDEKAMEIAQSILKEGLECEEKVVRDYAEECRQKWRQPTGNAVFEYAAKLLVGNCLLVDEK